MQRFWNVVKNVLAVVGGVFLLLVVLEVICSGPQQPKWKQPALVPQRCVEFKAHRLNWQAADKAVARWFDRMAVSPAASGQYRNTHLPPWRTEARGSYADALVQQPQWCCVPVTNSRCHGWRQEVREPYRPPPPMVYCP